MDSVEVKYFKANKIKASEKHSKDPFKTICSSLLEACVNHGLNEYGKSKQCIA